jgi:hypothetical protein
MLYASVAIQWLPGPDRRRFALIVYVNKRAECGVQRGRGSLVGRNRELLADLTGVECEHTILGCVFALRGDQFWRWRRAWLGGVVSGSTDGVSQSFPQRIYRNIRLHEILQVGWIRFCPTSKHHCGIGQFPTHPSNCVAYRSSAHAVQVRQVNQRGPIRLKPEHVRAGNRFRAFYTCR